MKTLLFLFLLCVTVVCNGQILIYRMEHAFSPLLPVLMNPDGDSLGISTLFYVGGGQEVRDRKEYYPIGTPCYINFGCYMERVGLIGKDSLLVKLRTDTFIYDEYENWWWSNSSSEIPSCRSGNLVMVSEAWFYKMMVKQRHRRAVDLVQKAKEREAQRKKDSTSAVLRKKVQSVVK